MKINYKQLKVILILKVRKLNLFIVLFLRKFLFFDNFLNLNNFFNFLDLLINFILLSLILNLIILLLLLFFSETSLSLLFLLKDGLLSNLIIISIELNRIIILLKF